MLKQIRHSVFETNSSSTHSLSYKWPIYSSFSDYLYERGKLGPITIGNFDGVSEVEESETARPYERINWLVGTLLNSEDVECRWYIMKLMENLRKLGAEISFVEPFSKIELNNYYRWLEKEVIEDIFSSEERFLSFIFDPTCVIETSVL